MSFRGDATKLVLVPSLAVLCIGVGLGGVLGSCGTVDANAHVKALVADSVRLAMLADNAADWRARDVAAAQRANARADSLVHVADSVGRIAASARARIVVRDRIITNIAGTDTLGYDPRLADAIVAMDQRHAADSLALVGLLVANDTLTQALASSDSLVHALDRQLAANAALRVAVEKVNRRPRFGFTTGLVVGVVATAGAIHLAGTRR